MLPGMTHAAAWRNLAAAACCRFRARFGARRFSTAMTEA
jgi:hypothetical protein